MIREKLENVELDAVYLLTEDILQYFDNEEDEDYEMNQAIIGIKDLFREYIIKAWKGIDFSNNDYDILNKIVVRIYVEYYIEYWKYRNKIFHDNEIQ